MTMALLVGVGGALGAIARYLVGQRLECGPATTLTVNVLGSLVLGVVVGAPVGDAAALALGTGFCGAFTTFSSFAVETVRLAEAGRRRRAALNATATLAAALAAVVLGAWIGGLVPPS